jgi:hypothetical protein
MAEPGVMIALEMNTSHCGVVVAPLTDAGLVEMRLLKGAGPSIYQDDGPRGIAEFGGE